MGVRMREYLAKMPGSGWKSGRGRVVRESGGHETTIIGLKVVEAKLQQLAYWSERDYNNIVAINKNGEANIFQEADFGIVGDYREAVPALIDKLQPLLERE